MRPVKAPMFEWAQIAVFGGYSLIVTDGWTDGRTDGRTESPLYWYARTYLWRKILKQRQTETPRDRQRGSWGKQKFQNLSFGSALARSWQLHAILSRQCQCPCQCVHSLQQATASRHWSLQKFIFVLKRYLIKIKEPIIPIQFMFAKLSSMTNCYQIK